MDSGTKTLLSCNGREITVSAKSRDSGECIVFLHGLQSNKDLFAEAFERKSFLTHSLLSIDFAGFGCSSAPGDFTYDLEEQADILAELLNKRHVANFHLVGHSLGGMVGTILLDKIPAKILSFSNLEGNFCFEDCGASREIASGPLRDGMSETLYLTARSIVAWSKRETLKTYWHQSAHRKILLTGDKSPYASKAMATASISNAGHFMLKDNPEETYAHIERFIASCT
jgi:pimeloyl-ACP methyl ester carboxylesterase